MNDDSSLDIEKEREEIHREQEEKRYENRKKKIIELVTAYYNKFDILQNRRLSELIDKALERYLDTDLTIEEINEQFMEIIVNTIRERDHRRDRGSTP